MVSEIIPKGSIGLKKENKVFTLTNFHHSFFNKNSQFFHNLLKLSVKNFRQNNILSFYLSFLNGTAHHYEFRASSSTNSKQGL